jgi:acyl dehydratase
MSEFRNTGGMYYEEFAPGMGLDTDSRTVTEADIMSFAGLSGDMNPMHTSARFAQGTPFGKRVAHGALIFSIATGLIYRMRIIEGTVLAFRSIDEWKFSQPVYIGDTIHCNLEVTETKDAKRLGGGQVVITIRVFNQDDKLVQKGSITVLVASKPDQSVYNQE